MKKSSFWNILIYFIVYSVLGFLIETIYAIFTKGMLESRQSFLYGPFCIVYGIAAVILIVFLSKYKNKIIRLFAFGTILGCIVEYYSSLIGELLLHVKWWDYSNDFFNINGRTCLFYAICWGFLTIALINYINPVLDKIINKIYEKLSIVLIKFTVVIITLFMTIDGLVTCYAIDNFLLRVANEYNITINGIENKEYNNIFSNEKMMMTYPNMIVVSDKNENLYLESILKDVKNYYYKFSSM